MAAAPKRPVLPGMSPAAKQGTARGAPVKAAGPQPSSKTPKPKPKRKGK